MMLVVMTLVVMTLAVTIILKMTEMVQMIMMLLARKPVGMNLVTINYQGMIVGMNFLEMVTDDPGADYPVDDDLELTVLPRLRMVPSLRNLKVKKKKKIA
jgi:hypothetical protein